MKIKIKKKDIKKKNINIKKSMKKNRDYLVQYAMSLPKKVTKDY